MVIASPQLAQEVLEDLSAQGKGNLSIFTNRRDYESTVATMLGDEELMSYNARDQARIDSIQTVIQNATGLLDEDFLRVPVLYEADVYNGMDLSIALNPGIQNLVTAGTTLFLPDPEGPLEGGLDHWQEATRTALSGTGLTLEFVDVFYGYHVQYGEAHCGTAVERTPMATKWWVEDEVTP
jgi:protein-arginine deiminase